MRDYTTAINTLTERLGLSPLKQLVRSPGVTGLYRLTCYYSAGQARHSAATLYCPTHTLLHRLEVVYEGFNQHKPLTHDIPQGRVEALLKLFGQVRFDTLTDQVDVAIAMPIIWQLERAAGPFHKVVLFTTETTHPAHAQIVTALHSHLPEALRRVPLRTTVG